ncbi:hypothetical protein [Paracoccus sp. Ld10]|uniref:hypothetical protein n=1 Tax=Paracoccus sp. Ld10 TaxID=649158 RepID=UPI00386A0DB5
MTLKQMLLAGGLVLIAAPAIADCSDRIAFLEEGLDDAARLAISASSGGQGVAGAREALSVTEGAADEQPAPYADGATEAVDEADDAGDGGEALIEARARLGEARTMADDEDACLVLVHEVLVGLMGD